MDGNKEKQLVSRQDAEALALKYRSGTSEAKQSAAIKKIPFSLLCAEHIKIVVEQTGLISPFYTGGGRKSRLKTSAYEGRIGDKAYLYDKSGNLNQIFNRLTRLSP